MGNEKISSPAWPGIRTKVCIMCLAIPAQVVELREGDNAVVDLAGVRKEISLALVDQIAVGDYVIVHVGYALNKLDPEEAARTLALFAEIGQLDEAPTAH
jgi:hydrogenase expression/formation protein HypC